MRQGVNNVFRLLLLLPLLLAGIQCSTTDAGELSQQYIQFVYCSDSHYGLEREFRGRDGVTSAEVNRAMVEAVNNLPSMILPDDGGVGAGVKVGAIDFVVNTGDISNRMEDGVQSASASWEEFRKDWIEGLRVKTRDSVKAPLYLLPGNHDVSNAIGYTKPMSPERDPGCLVGIYNTMNPGAPETVQTYDYRTDKVRYSFTLYGVHFAFVGMWPDSQAREWLGKDLDKSGYIPCLLFTHDEPDIEAKHLTNPHGDHGINATDKFQNLVCDTSSVSSPKAVPVKEYRELESFFRGHPSVRAYFHGNTNYNEFYEWRGPGNTISLNVFRVDSPMKGQASSEDEGELSFQLVTIDVGTKRMTVRECLWNRPGHYGEVVWGAGKTIKLN